MTRRVALPLVTAGYLALVAWATLGAVSWHAIGYEASFGVLTPSIWFDPATWSTGSTTEFGANIAMFVPVGVLYAMLAGPRRWFGALVAAFATTLAIELAQIPIADRISDPRDLLANAGGAVIGMLLAAVGYAVLAIRRAVRRRSAARRDAVRQAAARQAVVVTAAAGSHGAEERMPALR